MWNAAAWSIIKVSRKFSEHECSVLALLWSQESHDDSAEDGKDDAVKNESYNGRLTGHCIGRESSCETRDYVEHGGAGEDGKEGYSDSKPNIPARHIII